jgi:hypothetical protein
MTGNDLLGVCTETSPDKKGMCIGYILGVMDYRSLIKHTSCPPDTTIGQMKDAVVGFLQTHPEAKKVSAAFLVGPAIMATMKCQTQPDKSN